MTTEFSAFNWEECLLVVNSIVHSPLLYLLLAAVLLDFISGMGKALVTGQYSSSVGLNGVVKHTLIILLVIFLKFFGRIFGLYPTAFIMTILFILNYVASIFENMEAAGAKIPESVKNKFKQMQSDYENEIKIGPDDKIIIRKNEGKKGTDR